MSQVNIFPYLDASLSIKERVADLLSRMNLTEKVAQISATMVFDLLSPGADDQMENMVFAEEKTASLLKNGIGQIGRLAVLNKNALHTAEVANTLQKFLVEKTRLGIPAIIHEEAIGGFAHRDSTTFPYGIGLASTWEPELAEGVATTIREQMRAVGTHQAFSPNFDITRDPRWGRVEENFGEDPYLCASMGTAFVKGLRGDGLERGVLATGKHFVGHGASEGGLNMAPVHIGPRELREVHALPFEAAIHEAGLASIMTAYHEIDGLPCTSPEIIQNLLRGQLGFNGLVVSDYTSIIQLSLHHNIAQTPVEAARIALEAGVDVELPTPYAYGASLIHAVEQEIISEALIDRAVRQHLTIKFQLGLFEHPYVDTAQAAQAFGRHEHIALTRQIAQKAITLLKNEQGLLPLRKNISSIAVIGPKADDQRNMLGFYHFPGQVEALLNIQQTVQKQFETELTAPAARRYQSVVPVVTVLQAIKNRVAPDTKVYYAPGCTEQDMDEEGFAEAVEVARQCDVAVVVVGDSSGMVPGYSSGEWHDRATLSIPGVQEDLVRAIQGTGTRVVLVLVNGRPFAIPELVELLPAVVEAWIPAEQGGEAITDVLFGDFNPGGKLPISIPRAVGQVPVYYNHKSSGGKSNPGLDYFDMTTAPLFPFGHGLSYTQFELSNLQLSKKELDPHESIVMSVDVQNTGQRTGDEVVQLYIRDPWASTTRPVKELKGFKRLTLQAGEKKTVKFTLSLGQLGLYDHQMRYVVEPGIINVMIGSSSQDIRLEDTFEIVGEISDMSDAKTFFAQVDVQP